MNAVVDEVPVSTAVLDRLRELDIDVDEALRQASLDPARFAAPARARLSTRELFSLWTAVEAQVPSRRDFGLELGAGVLEQSYNRISQAALLSRDLREAWSRLGRYKKLVCPEHVELVVERGEAQVRFHWILADAEVPRLLADASFASFLDLARRGTGVSVAPRRLELARRRSDFSLLEAHFGCEVVFCAPYDRIVFAEDHLALPFRAHNAAAILRLVPALEEALSERAASGLLTDEVRVVIARQMYGGRPSVDKVARELHLSARTLQRRLEEASTSFQEQLDDVRQKTARRLLSTTDLDAVEVAFFLGFEEPNSFVRAFRAWEGTTPSRWRAESARSP